MERAVRPQTSRITTQKLQTKHKSTSYSICDKDTCEQADFTNTVLLDSALTSDKHRRLISCLQEGGQMLTGTNNVGQLGLQPVLLVKHRQNQLS